MPPERLFAGENRQRSRRIAGWWEIVEARALSNADPLNPQRGIRVDRPDQVGRAWDQALAADRPVVIDAITDPNVPPLPPHITYKEAKDLSAALLKGDPDAWPVIRQSFVGKMKEFVG